MIANVGELRAALKSYPDDMPITLWDGRSRGYYAPFIMEEDSRPSLEPVGNHDPADVVRVRLLADRP